MLSNAFLPKRKPMMSVKKSTKKTAPRASLSVLGCSLLSLLARKERTGYELSRFTSGVRSMIFASSGHSNIYKELAKLKRDNYVKFRVIKEARPFDKKVYSLTELGRSTLQSWLKSEPELFSNRQELNIRAHALWLLSKKDAAAFLDKQIKLAAQEIASLEAHSAYLQSENQVTFPPVARHPLFGTYSNILLEINSRKLTIDWCTWIQQQWDTNKTA
jgi:PadR family transcriptional regulator AphA